MKSIKSDGSVNCPNGCEPFEAEFWTLVAADEDAELKQSLLGGELNLVCCPSCGKFFYHDRNIIYFDHGAELLAFVSPSGDRGGFEKIKEKMQADFKLLKDNLKSVNINYDPFYLCGLEELKNMVDYEAAITAESEVLAAICGHMGYKLAPVRRAKSRLKGWPFYLPVEGGSYEKEAVLKAAKEIVKNNPHMRLLSAFIKDVSAGEPLPERL